MKFLGTCFIVLGFALAMFSIVFNTYQLLAIGVPLVLIGIVIILATEHADEDHKKLMQSKRKETLKD